MTQSDPEQFQCVNEDAALLSAFILNCVSYSKCLRHYLSLQPGASPWLHASGASELLLSDGERAQPSSTAHLEIQDASSHPSRERRKGGWRRCCSSMVFLQGVPCTTEIYGIGLGKPKLAC